MKRVKSANLEKLINQQGEKLFYFNWVGGGYNSEWARDEKHLIQKVEKKYQSSLTVDCSSITWVDAKERDGWDAIGWLMTI